MVAVKDAVSAVNAYLRSFPDLLDPKSPRLEETEFDQASGQWVITVSYETEPSGLAKIGDSRQRLYRVFRVSESGEVLSMKERSLSSGPRDANRKPDA